MEELEKVIDNLQKEIDKLKALKEPEFKRGELVWVNHGDNIWKLRIYCCKNSDGQHFASSYYNLDIIFQYPEIKKFDEIEIKI